MYWIKSQEEIKEKMFWLYFIYCVPSDQKIKHVFVVCSNLHPIFAHLKKKFNNKKKASIKI